MRLEQKIRRTAHEIWLQEGHLHGRPKERWFEAEQRIVQDEIGRLKDFFRQRQQTVNYLVGQIGIRLLKCDRVLNDYATLRTGLSRIVATLETLGVMVLSFPSPPPAFVFAPIFSLRYGWVVGSGRMKSLKR